MRWPAKCLRISLPMTRTSLRRCTYSDSLALCWLTPWPASTGCGTAARKTASQRSGPKIATESAYAKQKKPGTPKSTGPILILSATACNLNRSSNVSGNLGSRLSEGIHVRDVVEVVGDVVDLCLSFSTAGNMGNDDTGTSWHEQLWPFLTNDVSLARLRISTVSQEAAKETGYAAQEAANATEKPAAATSRCGFARGGCSTKTKQRTKTTQRQGTSASRRQTSHLHKECLRCCGTVSLRGVKTEQTAQLTRKTALCFTQNRTKEICFKALSNRLER